jgi:hypothetical protein
LRLGTKLTVYLSLTIMAVVAGYGYLDILSRRDILVRKMKAETLSARFNTTCFYAILVTANKPAWRLPKLFWKTKQKKK